MPNVIEISVRSEHKEENQNVFHKRTNVSQAAYGVHYGKTGFFPGAVPIEQ